MYVCNYTQLFHIRMYKLYPNGSGNMKLFTGAINNNRFLLRGALLEMKCKLQ